MHVTQREVSPEVLQKRFQHCWACGLPAGSIQSLRHSSGATANVWGPRTCEETAEVQPGAWSQGAPRAPVPLLPPASSPKHPGPDSQAKQPLPAHPQPGSHRHTQACVHPAHACTHTARAKARPLTGPSASPPPRRQALPSPCLTARWWGHGAAERPTQPHGVPAAALHGWCPAAPMQSGVQ